MATNIRPKRHERRRKLEIERDGASVRFVVHCADHYDAMALYDEATAAMRAGALDLTIVAGKASDAGDSERRG